MRAYYREMILRGIAIAVTIICPIAQSPAVAKQDPPLRFATYNVCKTSCGTGEFAWDKRKDAVIRNILSAKPDVLALQEVDNSYYWIDQRLQKHGYAMVEPLDDQCVDSDGCIDDSQLFYKTTRVSQLVAQVPSEPVSPPCQPYINDAGDFLVQEPPDLTYPTFPGYPWDFATYEEFAAADAAYRQQREAVQAAENAAYSQYLASLRQYSEVDEANNCERFLGRTPTVGVGSGGTDWDTFSKDSLEAWVDNRNFTWAALRDRRSGAAFMAVSMHMPNEKGGFAERYRTSAARGLVSFMNRTSKNFGLASTPTVLMGDFNSYWQRQPRGVQWILGRAGFKDAFHARTKVNEDVPTVNLTRTQPNPFPDKPFRFDSPARIDYVMVNKGTPLRYEVHLRLKGGRFDNRYRGSDHNLVLADVRLPRVKVPKRWVATG
jgi:endonuclease/exonuclease/phosphatase family metal-dependent hydrolase